MKMNQHRKTSTLMLVLLVLLAGAMLIGGTFAETFRLDDKGQQTLENNQPGMDYAVTLKYYDADAATPDYYPTLSAGEEITDSLFWCPGRTEIIYLKVENAEEFPLEAEISLKAQDVTGRAKFDNTLSYVVFDGLEYGKPLPVSSWSQVNNARPLTTGTTQIPLVETNMLATQGNVHYLALAIHMDEKASNAYQNAQMSLDFTLRVNANHAPGFDPNATTPDHD